MGLKIIGLKTATSKEIEQLKAQYPQGYHKTHNRKNKKLPYNGVFVIPF
jgi:hypothetical protein